MDSAGQASQIKKKKVLIIDDEVFFLQLVKPLLEKAGEYEVTTLISTKDLIKRINEFKPDIILLDIIMPDADGIEVCVSLKKEPFVRDIPVVMLSAMSRDIEKKKASEAGADDFIAKPVKKDDLINKIEEVLRRKKS
ncbi:MAG: response regulator [Candidatus Omnitrophota bacterium]|nr:response regulator [Candidatus Omnitrophota bacterium]